MKQKMVLLLSVLVGLLAFWFSSRYLRAQRDSVQALRAQIVGDAKQTWVLCAGHTIPADTVVQKTDFKLQQIFERNVGRNNLREEDVAQIVGKKLKYPLDKGELVLWSYFDVPFMQGSGLAPIIKPGMRAVSVSVGGAAAVSGLVQPNDRVDVLGTFYFPSKTTPGENEAVTLTVLQDVTVLATGQTLAKESSDAAARRRPAAGYTTVSFEVTPREAELLVFAETMKGRLTLSLRNPTDISYERDLPEINFEHIESKLPELNEYRQRTIRHKRD